MRVIEIIYINDDGEKSIQNVPINDGQGVLHGIKKFVSESHHSVDQITSADFGKAAASEDFRLFGLFSNINNEAQSQIDEIEKVQNIIKELFGLLDPSQRSQFWTLPSTTADKD
jgi:hypothetical protein